MCLANHLDVAAGRLRSRCLLSNHTESLLKILVKQCVLESVDHVNDMKLSATSQVNGASFVSLLADCT